MEKLKELWELYRSQIIMGLVILVGLVVVIGQRVTSSHAVDAPAATTMSSTASSSPTAPSMSGRQPQRICVDVKGAVKQPGIYYFKHGARVVEALRAAGGQLPNAEMKAVNLAKELTDQQVVYIPTVGEQVAPAPGSEQATSSDTGTSSGKAPININTASKEQLCQITGIGDKKADLIIAYRQEHGQFKSVDELTQVSGFGEKTVAKIKDQVAV
ncbi:helix-hairpin-helix domain-containing protein [Limosilactobacillus sp.]|uniref:helix-hairpin-helix domain-containing protein n=1 Tax=Limosilactobacillus sp. TaxID=2773925 RepID=UPI003F042F0D